MSEEREKLASSGCSRAADVMAWMRDAGLDGSEQLAEIAADPDLTVRHCRRVMAELPEDATAGLLFSRLQREVKFLAARRAQYRRNLGEMRARPNIDLAAAVERAKTYEPLPEHFQHQLEQFRLRNYRPGDSCEKCGGCGMIPGDPALNEDVMNIRCPACNQGEDK